MHAVHTSRCLRSALKHVRTVVTHHKPSYAESQLNRSFFLTVLAATATKRDAKAYIEKYQKPYNKARQVNVKDSATLQHFFEAEDGALIDVEPSLAKQSPVRVALITIRDPGEISAQRLHAIADTLSQLHRLGLQPVVMMDTNTDATLSQHSEQVDRLAVLLEGISLEARPIYDGLFDIRSDPSTKKTMHKKRIVSIYDTRTLKAPVSRRQIPVIRTVGIDQRGRKATITADSAMKALCKAFGAKPATVPFQKDMDRSAFVIDKLIIIDKVGGILSPQRKQGSHVFINLDQEALLLQRELATLASPEVADRHLRNLDTCQVCLDLLTDSSSAVVTTPEIAGSVAGVQHPLIYNLLTDKPMFSPSLPVRGSRTPTTVTTILRKGVPVRIFRNISLRSPEIDLEKLTVLINDSFARRLDVEAYLTRVGDSVEALIVAGDYDGAAIITSERVPSRKGGASGESSKDKDEDDDDDKPIPYLDKFAVLRSKQGAGGVADILFNAMMTQFPDELTWRSRDENPVNKWYFERARGTLLVPAAAQPMSNVSKGARDESVMQVKSGDATTTTTTAGVAVVHDTTRWRLFWTVTPTNLARFEAYIHVARNVQPTWLP